MMKLFSILALIQLSSCINISPVPNLSFKLPSKNAEISKTRSTYFGYSINLRRNSIIIGAPRSNSTVLAQKKVYEPGVIFKCKFDQSCKDYNFDVEGNEEKYEKFDSRKKGLQMLGAVISGGSSESDPLLVCAPNFRAVEVIKGYENDHFVHGICFVVDQTNSSKPIKVQQISPLKQRNQQFSEKVNYLYHDGMSGFSADISENNEIILGCPGVRLFSGTIARYQPKKPEPNILDTPTNDKTAEFNYFGYSVSSGMFLGKKKGKISYVASVPRKTMKRKDKIFAHNGTVVIFNMNNLKDKTKIQTVQVISGTQFGEYFGYSLLTEDFNNDGFADLAVSAPLYSKDGNSENGAVYIFMNSGLENKVELILQTILKTDFTGNGRFGTALGKIGDINGDGYKDLAVSAPFENNGKVYIFLGSKTGISTNPVQNISAPEKYLNSNLDGRSAMFGFSISGGSDIDSNGFDDFAIGSPNSEQVFIYKTYPLVAIEAQIKLKSSILKLPTINSEVTIDVCAKISSRKIFSGSVLFNTTLTLDKKYSRAYFDQNLTISQRSLTHFLDNKTFCYNVSIFVHPSIKVIYQEPLRLKLKYELVDKVEDQDENFCKTCVVLDSGSSNEFLLEVPFDSRCVGKNCTTKLAVKGKFNSENPFVLGSSKSIEIVLEISNSGEAAYFTKLKVSVSTSQFLKIPPFCYDIKNLHQYLECDINGVSMLKDEKLIIPLHIDSEKLDGKSITIFANVTSEGEEFSPEDNSCVVELSLKNFSKVEVIGKSSESQFTLIRNSGLKSLEYGFKIFNSGPSDIKKLSVEVFVPVAFKTGSYGKFKIIDVVDDFRPDDDSDSSGSEIEDVLSSQNNFKCQNSNQNILIKNNDVVSKLSLNDTILFDCRQENVEFQVVEIQKQDLKAHGDSVDIKLNLKINLKKVATLFNDQHKIFLFQTFLRLTRVGDSETLNVTLSIPYTIIFAPAKDYSAHIIVASVLGGILTLSFVTWVLKKTGFFKREKRDEIKRKIRESRIVSLKEIEKVLAELENDSIYGK